MSESLVYRRLRAPREDKALLLEPKWAEAVLLAAANAKLINSYDCDLHGRSFASLRSSIREELIRRSMAYTNSYLDVEQPTHTEQTPLIVSGHQPTLFHPSVWSKNFAIDRLAREVDGLAIQVVIDNDDMRSHSILCPSGSTEEPIRVAEPFDSYSDAIPFEMRFAQDNQIVRSFAERVAAKIKPFVETPLVTRLWPDVLEAIDRGKPLGHAFAIARHRLENRWGSRTLEIPLSQICDTVGFRWFALHLLHHASEVRDAYNDRLEQYRAVHRLRNQAQPLPNLDIQDEWVETPFWMWTDDDPSRRTVWVRRKHGSLELSDRQGGSWSLNIAQNSLDYAAEQLCEFRNTGFRLRPKALANTMFLRLFCADTFVHGIGGAKYDQVTDLLICDLFGWVAPKFVVLSLTTLLPSPSPLLGVSEIIHKRQKIREMYFHPERFLPGEIINDHQVSSKVISKRKLIGRKPNRRAAAAWHQSIAEANVELREYLQEKTDKEKKNLSGLLERQKLSQIFSSREWSFCLFPEALIKERLLDLNYESP